MEKNLILINGEIMPMEEAQLSYMNRGHLFGDGVFEVVPVYNGKAFALVPHMENLFDYTIKTKIPGIYTIGELIEFHEALLEATGLTSCEVYTQITRGTAPYDLGFPHQCIPELVMFALPVDRKTAREKAAKGVNVITVEDDRWANCDINTLNRMPEVMAKEKAVIGRAYDALFVRDGKITEGTESTFFVYKDGILWTHPEGKFIHRNVTRRLLKEKLCGEVDLQIMERPFTKEFALGAEGAFLCGPRCEFVPVTKIDRTLVNGGKVSPIMERIQDAFFDFVLKECPMKC